MAHAKRTLALLALAGVALFPPPRAAAQGGPIDVGVRVVPLPSPAGLLTIRRIELLFPNGRGEITVPLDAALGARAVVDYVGNGALTGRWLVDGRPIQEFNQTLLFGSTLTLETAAIPGLPTFEPGRHEVTLQLTSPAVAFPIPVVRYVVESAPGPGRGAITLVEPADGAEVAASARTTVGSAQAGIAFTWSQASLPAPRYLLQVLQGGSLVGSALVDQAQSHLMPPAAVASLPRGARLTWRVLALGTQGEELAASGASTFTVVSPAAIQLVTPAEGESIALPYRFSWTHPGGPTASVTVSIGSTAPSQGYELRVYRNDASLRADLQALQSPSQGTVSIVTPGGATAAGATGGTTAWTNRADPYAPIFLATTTSRSLDVAAVDLAVAGPGAALRWAVVFRDGTGRVVAVSESGGFVLDPGLRAVGGLPAVLEMAGQEIAVQAYAPGASLVALAGNGSVRFRKDRSRRDVPLPFQNLAAGAPYVERRRVVAGNGYGTSVTIVTTLRAAVTSGRIAERFAQPLAMDLAGYPARLSALTLQEGAGPSPAAAGAASVAARGAGLPTGEPVTTLTAPAGVRGDAPTGPGAWADLQIDLPAYVQAAGGGTATAAMPGTRLGAGGDFYRELYGAEAPTLAIAASAAGPLRYQRTGTLVADFTPERDWVGPDGAHTADGLVLLADGLAELPASALFPVLEPASLRLVAGIASLAPDGYRADFDVLESDSIHPVVPAGYAVTFTGGRLSVAGGAVVGSALRLDGRATLPEKVHRVPAGAAIVPFRGMALQGGWLRASIDAGDLQWSVETGMIQEVIGPGGDSMAMAKAQLAPAAGAAGGGTAEPATPPAATPPKVAPGGGATTGGTTISTIVPTKNVGHTGAAVSGSGGLLLRTDPLAVDGLGGTTAPTAEPGKPFVLRAAKGTLDLPFATPGPDPALAGLSLSSGWLESPFLPDPAGSMGSNPGDAVTLRIRAAGVRGSISSIDSPIRMVPRKMALGDFLGLDPAFSIELVDNAVIRSSVDGRLLVPKPADLVFSFTGATISSTGEVVGPALAVPRQVNLGFWHVSLFPVGIELSRSWLRFRGGEMRFPVDGAFGGDELAPLSLQQLDLGADGQVKAVATGTGAAFLGIPFALDSESATTFATGTDLPPGPGQALVTLSGLLSFPVLNRAMRVTVEHTASGAAVHFADGSYTLGQDNADSVFVKGDMSFVNGYAKGKTWKEFLGLAQVKALGTADLVGLANFGRDAQGLYQRFGIGIGVDADKAASLYQSGGVSVGVKLGGAAVALATGGEPHAKEVTALVGDVAELAAGGFKTQADMDKAMFKAVGDAVRLARLVHLDTGGKAGDGVETALSLVAASLSLAQDLSGKSHTNLAPQQTAVLVLTALDVAFPILERSDFARGKPETLAVLAFVRLGARATRLHLDDGRLSDKDWFALGKQLFQSARPLSEDAIYRLAMDVMAAVFTAAEGAKAADDAALVQVASAILGAVRQSGALRGPDWKNVLVVAQALLDAALAARSLPWPENGIALGQAVLDAAAGTETDYGSDADDRKVKAILKLSRRTLDAIAATGAGIPYDRAAVAVKDAYDSAAVAAGATDAPRFGVQETVQRLVDLWARLKGRPIADSLADLRQLLCDVKGDAACATPDAFDAQVASAIQSASGAATAAGLASAMGHLVGLAEWARRNAPPGDPELYRNRMRSAVSPVAASLETRAADLATRELAPRVATATTPEQAGEAAALAHLLAGHAQGVGSFVAGSGGTPISALDWDQEMAPVEAALASARAAFARDIRARLESTLEPREAVALRTAWRKVEPPRADDPLYVEMEAAFAGRRAPLVAECKRRIEGQMLAPIALVKNCSLAFFELYGTASGSDLSLAAFDGLLNLVTGLDAGQIGLRAWGWSLFTSSATALAESAQDPVTAWVSLLSSARTLAAARGKAVDFDAGLEALLDELVAQVGAGTIGEGSVFQYLVLRALVARGLFSSPTAGSRLARVGPALVPIASQTAPQRLAELDIESTTPSEAVSSAGGYWLVAQLLGNGVAAMEARVPGWIQAARAAPCAKRLEKGAWLAGMRPFLPAKAQELWDAANGIERGCGAGLTFDPAAELAKIATAGGEIKAEIDRLVQSGMSDEDKREAIAWFVAARVESLTAGFTGEADEEKVLRAVHTQAKLVNQYRLRPRPERIAAVGDVIVAALGDLFPGSAGAAPVVKAAFVGLRKFVEAGSERLPPGQRALELLSTVALEATPGGEAKALVGGWLGLLKSHTAATATLTAIPIAVATGVAIALHDKVKTTAGKVDFPATFAAFGLEGEFWTVMGERAPVIVEVAQAAAKLKSMIDALRNAGGTPAEKLAALDKFVTEAPKLAGVGRYVAAVLKPEAHLLAPDADQGVWLPNAVLAFLDTARGEVPGSSVPPKAATATRPLPTCPSVDLLHGTSGLVPQAQDALLCAVDVGRKIVREGMSAFFGGPPSPYRLLDVQARQALERLRQDSVFARAGADENLSGLSGQLEVRPGSTAPRWTLDVLATLSAKPVIDSAARLTLSSQDHLRLELASADPRGDTRTADALARVGYQYAPGVSRLFGSADLGNPVRYLLVDFDGKAACFRGALSLVLQSPLGALGTNETGLDVCWNPAWFALRNTVSWPIGGLSLARVHTTFNLCAGTRGSFSGAGLDVGLGGSLDIPIPLTDYGFYAGLDFGLGFAPAIPGPGVRIGGAFGSQIGLYKSGLTEADCIGHPLVDVVIWRGFYGGGWEETNPWIPPTGICRSGLGFHLDVLANLAPRGSYLKARGGFDAGPIYVGGWLYSDDAGLQGGAGSFPESLGGFTGSRAASGASVCGGAP